MGIAALTLSKRQPSATHRGAPSDRQNFVCDALIPDSPLSGQCGGRLVTYTKQPRAGGVSGGGRKDTRPVGKLGEGMNPATQTRSLLCMHRENRSGRSGELVRTGGTVNDVTELQRADPVGQSS